MRKNRITRTEKSDPDPQLRYSEDRRNHEKGLTYDKFVRAEDRKVLQDY